MVVKNKHNFNSVENLTAFGWKNSMTGIIMKKELLRYQKNVKNQIFSVDEKNLVIVLQKIVLILIGIQFEFAFILEVV